MKIPHILALFLTTSLVWGGTLGDNPRWRDGETIYVPTQDPRIKQIRFFKVGANGVGGITGDFCPPGKVWKLRAVGMFTDDGQYREWMMQIQVTEPFGPNVVHPFDPSDPRGFAFMLVPFERPVGFAMGTPPIAARDIILMPGEAICGRVGGILPDRQIGLLYAGWEFDEELLPQLLGVGGNDCDLNPALSSINREIKGLEKSKQSLK